MKINYLTIISEVKTHNGSRNVAHYKCICECGKEVTIRKYNVDSGNTKSCGCKQAELVGAANRTHGLCDVPEYDIWSGIIGRCYNPNNSAFNDYGERGITMCDRWRDSFQNFYNDMGVRPTSSHTIERIDNNGNYEPGNCKWATRKEQNRNFSLNRVIEFDGRSQCLAAWVEELQVSRNTFYYYTARLGYSDSNALSKLVSERHVSSDDDIVRAIGKPMEMGGNASSLL